MIGSLIRTDGPGSHHILITGETPAYGEFIALDTPDKQVAIVVGITALDTLGGRYDAAFEQSPGLSGVFDLEIGEKVRLAQVIAVGRKSPHEQSRPPVSAPLGATAHAMDSAEIDAFHMMQGKPRMGYHSLLAGTDTAVMDAVLAAVHTNVPAAASMIQVLRRESSLRAWRNA